MSDIVYKRIPYQVSRVHRIVPSNDSPTESVSTVNFERDSDYAEKNYVPNYRELIAAGSSASSPYYRRRENFSYSVGTASVFYNWTGGGQSGDTTRSETGAFTIDSGYQDIGQYAVGPPSSLSNEVDVAFLNKMNSVVQSFSTGTFIGEMRETLRMLKRPLASLRNGFSDYLRAVDSRTSRRPRHRIPDIVSGTYLEYKFGWAPLISDIRSIGRLYNQVIEKYPGSSKVRATRSHTVNGDLPNAVRAVFDPRMRWILDYRSEKTWRMSLTGIFGGNLHATSFSEAAGLNLSSFRADVWNLLPWSFVVDYFVNVGDCITASSVVRIAPITLVRSTKLTASFEVDAQFDHAYAYERFSAEPSYSGVTVSSSPCNTRLYYMAFSRSIESIDNLRVVPSISVPPLDSPKWLNLAALTQQYLSTSANVRRRFS